MTNWLAYIQNWAAANIVGSFDAAGTEDGLKVATSGNYAYIVRNDGIPDFMIVDISNLSSPTLVGSLTLIATPTNIAVSGNYAYITTTSSVGELLIIDVSNPASPSQAGFRDISGTVTATDVHVAGNYAYVTRQQDAVYEEFIIVDISNPSSNLPSQIDTLGYPANINAVYAVGSYAYLATSSDTAELLVVRLSNLADVVIVATLDLPGTGDGMTITGYDSTLLLGHGSTLSVINRSSPSSPSLLSSVSSSGSATINDVAYESTKKYAFIGTSNTSAEYQVASIGNLSSISIAGTKDIVGTSSSLNGVAYSSSKGALLGVSSSDTQELLIFVKN